MTLKRSSYNPLLTPREEADWESHAVFNGSIAKAGHEMILIYRAMGREVVINGKKLRLSTLGRASSADGKRFTDRTPFMAPEQTWEQYGQEDPRVTFIEGKYYIFYTALGNYPPNYQGIRCAVAISKDLKTIDERHLVTPFNAKAMTLFPEKVNGKYLVFLSVNTDRPPSYMAYALLPSLESLWDESFWNNWYEHLDEHVIDIKRMNTDGMEIGATPIKTDHGWLMFYSYIKHYFNPNLPHEFRIEAVLLDLKKPWEIVGRISTPLLTPEEPYEREGIVKNIVFPESAWMSEHEEVTVYYGGADTCICAASATLNSLLEQCETSTPTTIKCEKFTHNPLLCPVPTHKWEDVGVLNPAVVELEGCTYILYRAQSSDKGSRIGLAISHDGLFIDERLPEPIYVGRESFELPVTSGTGWGCEDPRVTVIDGIIYMLYTAYDGQVPRVALTSISTEDFLARHFDKWATPIVITRPQEANKDGVLFPEKVNGSYVLFHRIEPNVSIDRVSDISFKTKQFITDNPVAFPRNKYWDEVKIGINTPPIRTVHGWLALYHGISRLDRQYRVGAMLFDLQSPERLIARTPYPILEPQSSFETVGYVGNVVFPCGWVLRKSGDLYIYYGGADSVVCGASIKLTTLLDYMIRSKTKQYIVPS